MARIVSTGRRYYCSNSGIKLDFLLILISSALTTVGEQLIQNQSFDWGVGEIHQTNQEDTCSAVKRVDGVW